MKSQVIIFYIPGMSNESLAEISRQMGKVLNKYGVDAIFTSSELKTIGRSEFLDAVKVIAKNE